MDFSSQSAPRLAAERKRLDLSQEAAAKLCGVSREMWGKYERAKASMGTEVLAAFAVAGADALYILTGARTENTAHSPMELAFLRNCRALPSQDARMAGLNILVELRKALGITELPIPHQQQAQPAASSVKSVKASGGSLAIGGKVVVKKSSGE